MLKKAILASTLWTMSSVAHAQDVTLADLPDIARAMLLSAYSTGDPAQVSAVADALISTFPVYTDEISSVAARQVSELTPPEVVDAPEAAPVPSGGLFAIGPWKGKIQASASNASGNASNIAAGLLLDAARASGQFTHNFDAYIDYGEAAPAIDPNDPDGPRDRSLTQQRWGAAYKLDYNFSDRAYAFGRISFDEDHFSGFDYRAFAGGGLGYFLAQRESLTWKIEGGPGYQYSPIDDTRENLSEIALYASSETDWVIREGLIFEQDFRVTWTSPTTTLVSVTSLTSSLTKNLGAGIAFEYRYETSPPFPQVNADTVLRANITYGF